MRLSSKEVPLSSKEAFALFLYFGSDEGRKKLPTMSKFLSSAIAAGISEYITGEPCRYVYKDFDDSDDYRFHVKEYIDRAWQPNDKLTAEQIAILKPLVYSEVQIDGAGDRSQVNLCDVFRRYIKFAQCSLDSLPKVEIYLAQAIIAASSAEEIRTYEAIGLLVQKYIAADIRYINRRYSW